MSNPMITISVRLDGRNLDRVLGRVKRKTDDAVHSASRDFIDDIRNHWSGHYPPASKPGQPPAVRTGHLDRSIRLRRQKGGYYAIYDVYADAAYGKFLERGTSKMAARPFLDPAVKRLHRKMRKAFQTVMQP